MAKKKNSKSHSSGGNNNKPKTTTAEKVETVETSKEITEVETKTIVKSTPAKTEDKKNDGKKDEKKKKPNGIVKWFRDANSEFKKVTWMSPKQLAKTTTAVTIAVVIAAISLYGVNRGLNELFKLAFNI